MIRDAAWEDLPAVLRLGREFWAESGADDALPFSDEAAMDTLCELVDGGLPGCLLVADDAGRIIGAAGAVFYPHPFSGVKTGMELFWRAAPGHGRGLMAELEARARAAGCKAMVMGGLEAKRPEAVQALYVRAGYTPMERGYVRALA